LHVRISGPQFPMKKFPKTLGDRSSRCHQREALEAF
jgi:hypothetical protein